MTRVCPGDAEQASCSGRAKRRAPLTSGVRLDRHAKRTAMRRSRRERCCGSSTRECLAGARSKGGMSFLVAVVAVSVMNCSAQHTVSDAFVLEFASASYDKNAFMDKRVVVGEFRGHP